MLIISHTHTQNFYGRRYAGKEVASELAPAGDYWLAEDYHQVSVCVLLSY